MSKFWKVCLLVGMGMVVFKSEASAVVTPSGPVSGGRSCQECGCECMFVGAGNDCLASSCGLNCQIVDGLCEQVEEDECSQANGVMDEIVGWYGAYRTMIYNSQYDYSCNGIIDINDVIEWYIAYRNGGVDVRPPITGNPLPTDMITPTPLVPTATIVPTSSPVVTATPIPTMPQTTRTPAPTAGDGCLVSGMSCSNNSDCCSGVCDISMAECVGDPPAP